MQYSCHYHLVIFLVIATVHYDIFYIMPSIELLRYLMQYDDISINNDNYFSPQRLFAVSIDTYIVRMLTGDELVKCIVL